MKKALIVATIAGFVGAFELSDISILKSLGYEVHCATDFCMISSEENKKKLVNLVVQHQISFKRNPAVKGNREAYKKLKQLIEEEQFDIIHCHTPVGGVIARLAARKNRKMGTKVIYTAHGFHFFKGASVKNWLFFYPVEWLCSWWTDILITINQEDYQRARKHFHAKRIERIHGVGIDMNRFSSIKTGREEKRKQLGIDNDEFLILSVGELGRNKNHIIVLEAMRRLKERKCHFLLAGKGKLREEFEKYIKTNHLENCVTLLGHRFDIPEILNAADVFVFPSFREGLSVALMEAAAMKLPIICSKIRGNTDIVITEESYFDNRSPEQLTDVIQWFMEADNKEKIEQIVQINCKNLQKYYLSEVQKEMTMIYQKADSEISNHQ